MKAENSHIKSSKTAENPATSSDLLSREFRAGRLIQVLLATEFSLLVIAIQRVALGHWQQTVAILILAVSLSSVYLLAKKGFVERGAALLLSVLTLVLTYFMWRYEGIKDETLLAYPSILIFAVLIGSRKLFIALFLFMLSSIALNGYVNTAGIYINQSGPSSIDSAVLMVIILCLVSFSIWLLSNDLLKLFTSLARENQRVIHSQQEIEMLIHHDALTKLPNRILARDRFEQAVANALRESTIVCMMFVDLDNFKNINDSLGHRIGDQFLIELSKKIKQVTRKTDCVCRLGGDEFLVILENIRDKNELLKLIEKITNQVKTPIVVSGSSICVTGSLGIALAPTDGTDFDSILQKADLAMYRAKEQGKNSFCFFDREMNVTAQANISLVADMHEAIQNKHFYLVYQPKIDLENNTIAGVEALIRWRHPTKGLISPAEFIPLAESSGLIIEVGAWVIESAISQCASWRNGGVEMPIAINISSIQFKRSDIDSFILSLLEQYDLPGRYIELELTESLLFEHSSQLTETLANLRKAGIRFSIDDFGTGYSNLGYLKNFDIESLKIDQSFIRKLETHSEDKAIVTAIVQMAKGLHMKTVAEGIETKNVAAILKALECDLGQGYFWSKPILADELLHFARTHSTNVLTSIKS